MHEPIQDSVIHRAFKGKLLTFPPHYPRRFSDLPLLLFSTDLLL